MSDFDEDESLEDMLRAQESTLQAKLDEAIAQDRSRGFVFVDDPGVQETHPPPAPRVGTLAVAAGLLVLAAFILFSLVTGDSGGPISVAGGDVASPTSSDPSPESNDGSVGDAESSDRGSTGTEGGTGETNDQSSNDQAGDGRAGDAEANDPGTGDSDKSPSVDDASASDDLDVPVEEPTDVADNAGDGASECTAGEVLRKDRCVVIGASPTRGTECPRDAESSGTRCYEIVEMSCGDLESAPDVDGCLKQVAASVISSVCPTDYELRGATCLKLVPLSVNCAQGIPAGDSCLLEHPPVFPAGTGCAFGQTQYADGCYVLSSPTTDCGGLPRVGASRCRLAVDPQSTTTCRTGFEPLGDTCYRYEAPIAYECEQGESDGTGRCRTTQTATPGPQACGPGVLQDAQGCYTLRSITVDGSCGELPMFQGGCRQDKAFRQTWTCADGTTSYQSTCETWTQTAVLVCSVGEPVDNNTRCATFSDPITTDDCPNNSIKDARGCYTPIAAEIDCGDLEVAPEGEHCRQWVQASSATPSCDSGFEFIDDSCKKYVDGTPGTCPGAERVIVLGALKCRSTATPTDSAPGCTSSEIERSGNCYQIVPLGCGELDTDPEGTGCVQPVDRTSTLRCEAGFALVDDECLNL